MRREEKSLSKLFTLLKRGDLFFLQLTLALVVLGILFAVNSSTYESYRLTNNFWALGLKQVFSLCVGLVLLSFIWIINLKPLEKNIEVMSIVAFILMLLTVFSPLGKTIGGSQRWLNLGFGQFQPAEFAKLMVIGLVAKQLSIYDWLNKKSYYYLGACSILLLVILKQPDLGTTLILSLVIFQLLFIFEWPLWQLALLSVFSTYGAYLKIASTPYQLDRLKFWINPFLEPLGRGYNLIQAKLALGHGSIIGVGVGNSIQKQGYLPVPHSDFIFAVIGEEIGFIGLFVILILITTWFLRGMFLLNTVSVKFYKIFGMGILLLTFTQSVANVCVSIGLLPVTGVTLPFFSCGGTSLILTLAMCGILFNIISNYRLPGQP